MLCLGCGTGTSSSPRNEAPAETTTPAQAAGNAPVEKPQPGERTALVAVPAPELSRLGAAVQQQLRRAQGKLDDLARKPEVAATERATAYGELGRLYHAYDLLDAAEACYRNAHILAPDDYRWCHYLADAHRWQGESDDAIAAFNSALELKADDVPAMVALAEVLLEAGQRQRAKPLFERSMQLAPSAAAMVGLAKIAAADKDFDTAIRLFESALAQQPKATSIHYPLAMAYRGKGDLETAQRHAAQRGDTRVRTDDPLLDSLAALKIGAEYHLKQGVAAGQAGDLARALAELQAAVAADPNNAAARLNLGTALALSRDKEGAIRQYGESLRLDPRSAQAHFNLAVLLAERQDQRPAALEHYQQAVALDPEYLAAHLGLADLLVRSGQHAQAAEHYGRAVQIDPRNRTARLAQAIALGRSGQYPAAHQQLVHALEVLPDDLDLKHALARLLASCPDDSVRDGQRALELAQAVFSDRNSPPHAETVAMAFAEVGDFDQAVHWQSELVRGAEQAGRDDLLPRARQYLERYRAHQPCRDPWPAE